MIKVKQTIYGKGADGNGDCLRACIASIFELPIEEVPNFADYGTSYLVSLKKFLKKYGLEALTIWQIRENDWKPDGYHLIYGYSKRGVKHAVVGYKGKIVFDPYPDADDEHPELAIASIESYTVFVGLLEKGVKSSHVRRRTRSRT